MYRTKSLKVLRVMGNQNGLNPHKMRRTDQIMPDNRLSSKLINNQSTHTNFPITNFQPMPTGDDNFLTQFCTFTNFKNVLENRNRSKFVRGPNLNFSTIWEKKIWELRKKTRSLFSGPYNSKIPSLIFKVLTSSYT